MWCPPRCRFRTSACNSSRLYHFFISVRVRPPTDNEIAERWPDRSCAGLGIVDQRLADAAAVIAIASGSAHNTIRALNHRISCLLSASAPTSSAMYRMGAVPVSIRRP